MKKSYLTNFLLVISIGIGLLAGWSSVGWIDATAQVTADLFLRLLKLISLPIIFLSIASTISGMRDFREMKEMGRRVIGYTIATTVIAATVALALFLFLKPAQGISPLQTSLEVSKTVQEGSYLKLLLDSIPSNLFKAFLDNNVIGIALIAFGLSIAILFLPKEQKEFLHNLFSSLFAALLKVTSAIITLMPLAILAFVILMVKDLKSTHHFHSLLIYLCCVVSANLLQGIVILPLLLKLKKISPLKAFKGMIPALTLAFFSKSSNATLPVTMRSIEKMGISERVSSFTLPLCSVINMNGCAAFILTTVLFVGTINGLHFSVMEYIGWIFLATLAAIGNAGVPMGCFFLTSAFLVGMNLPLTMMGFILPFYAFLDMIETTLNVWSDGCVAITVDRDLLLAKEREKLTKDAVL